MAAPSCSTQTLTGKSHFRPTVTLYDWWLVKYETEDQGKRVAVAGVSSAGHEARRVFASAPISKVHDVFTLETTDGYCINLKGFINMERTTANGFPDAISKSFLFGFPELWEKLVAEFLGGDCNFSCSGEKQSSPTFVDNYQEETPHEQVVWEDRHDVGLPKQNASSNITFHKLSTDDAVHHTAEEDTSKEKIKSTYSSCIGSKKSLEDKLKSPVSRGSVTHTNNKFIASSKAFESLGGVSGAGAQSRQKMEKFSKGKHSVQAFCETVRNTDDCEVGGRGVKRSNSTSVHFNSNSTFDDSKMDDLVNHAAEEEIITENIASSEAQCIASSKTLDVIEKNPGSGYLMNHKMTKFSPASGSTKMDDLVNYAAEEEMLTDNIRSTEVQCIGSLKTPDVIEQNAGSGYLMKHKITKFSPASGSIESLDVISDATAQSSGKMGVSEKSLSDFASRLSKLFSGINRRKGNNKKTVGDGLNSESKPKDSVPAVSKCGISILQNESCEVGGNKMPCPSDSEFQEPTSLNVIRRLEFEFDFVEDDQQQTSNAKKGHDRDNVTAQVGEEENASRKRNKKKIAADTQETHLTTDVNQKGRASACLLKVNKETKASPSPSNMNKKSKSFSSTLKEIHLTTDVNQKGRASACLLKVNKETKASPSPSNMNKKSKSFSSTLKETHLTTDMNQRGRASACLLKVNKETKASPSPSNMNKKSKSFSSTLKEIHLTTDVNQKGRASACLLKVNKETKASPSPSNMNKKSKSFSSTLKETHLTTDMNQRGRASACLLKVNKETKASPSPSNMNKKSKSFSSTLKVNRKTNATPSIPVVRKKRKRSSTNKENQSTNCTPCRSKISIVSPESLGFRRSRSGRLQLPPMEFWRNQSPIYDADHGVIGIQEELPIITRSRGSTSRPQKRKACRG